MVAGRLPPGGKDTGSTMPLLSRWFVRTAFLALVFSLGIETALAARPAGIERLAAPLHLLALHLFTVGWLLQLIAGVAYWMFPRHPTRPPRGPERPGWVAYGLLNTGLALRALAEPWRAVGGPGWPLILSSALQFGGVLALAALLWPRIQAR
jgi:cytochrome bd-type quinol oxidase subunit 2